VSVLVPPPAPRMDSQFSSQRIVSCSLLHSPLSSVALPIALGYHGCSSYPLQPLTDLSNAGAFVRGAKGVFA